MNSKWISALVGAALLTTTIAPAGAVNMSDLAATGAAATAAAVQSLLGDDSVDYAPPTQDGHNVGFTGLEKTVRANNPTIKSFSKTLNGIDGTDVGASYFLQSTQYQQQVTENSKQVAEYEKAVSNLNAAILAATDDATKSALRAQLNAAQTKLKMSQQSVAAAQMALKGLDDAEDTAQENLDDQFVSTQKQFDNAANQLVIGAQTAYIGLVQIDDGLATMDRNLASLDRNITAVEKQVELGMAGQLTLDNLKQTRRTLAAQRETTVQQRTTTENQLSLLCGNAANTTVHATTLTDITESQIKAMNYDKDLELVNKNSYSIWSKQDAVRQASNNYEDDLTSTLDAFEAAKIDLEAEKENVANAFRKLFLDVQDKYRLFGEAQAAYDTEQKNFAVDEVKYKLGTESKNDYMTAQDDLAAKEDAVTSAKRALFTAYNTYDWAKRGVLSTT